MLKKGYFTKALSCLLILSMVFTLSGGIDVPVMAATNESTVVTYPLQSCDAVSEQLELTVNGQNVPIVKFMSNYDYCHFSFDGNAELIITVKNGTVGSYSISPLALEVAGTVDGNQLRFTLEQSRYLIVKIGTLRDLVIAADDLETDVPTPGAEGVFTITDARYGADPSGADLATEAIQRAIDDAAAYGSAEQPGVVYVPAGLFTFTSITLKSHVSLYLAGGAVLKASTDVSQYGKAMFHKNSVGMDGDWNITTEPNSENVKLYGRGTVDGSGMELRYQKNRINHVIIPMQCSGFTMDGIVVRDGALWTVVPVRCDHVTITNTKHLNDVRDNTEDDAIDIVECQDVLVRHTVAVSEDDTYSTKTWYEGTDIAPNWAGSPEPVDNVVFDDCFAFTRCGGFKIGWGCYQPQSNVTFKNSYVFRCMFAVLVTMNYGDVPVKNVTFENIDVEGFWPKDTNRGRWLEFWVSGGCSGRAENILVKDINIRTNNHIPSPLKGRNDTACFDGVTLQNITMPGANAPARTLEEMHITDTNEFVKNVRILSMEGDVDENGSVNVADIVTLKGMIMDGNYTDAQLTLGDLNHNGKPDVGDILAIKNIIMGQ